MRFNLFSFLILVLNACGDSSSTQLSASFDSLKDSLIKQGYAYVAPVKSDLYPKSIAKDKIVGDYGFNGGFRSDTVFYPSSLHIQAKEFTHPKGIRYHFFQFDFEDPKERERFNQFIPFSQFHLANNKTPGQYFTHEGALYLEYTLFP